MALYKYRNLDYLIFILITMVSGIVSLALGKDTNWDLHNYHFYNGYAFLTNRLDYDIAPAQLQTYLNPLLDAFIYLGIRFLPGKFFTFALGAIQGVSIWFVYRLTRIVTKENSDQSSVMMAILAAITAFLGAGWFSEIGNTMGDSIISVLLLLALLLSVSCPCPITLDNGKKIIILVGFILGFCTGLKLVEAVFFIGFFISIVFLMQKDQILKLYLFLSAAFTIGLTASIGFWMIKLWIKFQNPLFPFFNKFFKSPYFDQINFTDQRFLPRTLLHKIFYPFFFAQDPTLVGEGFFRDFRLPVLYLFVVLFLLWTAIRFIFFHKDFINHHINHRTTFFLTVFTLISYTGWQTMFSIYRYVIPLELLSPIVVIAVMNTIMKDSRLRDYILFGLLIFMVVTVWPMNWGRDKGNNNYLSFTSSVSLSTYKDSTILMAGNEPISYVIPFFPSTTRFVRIESNFITPKQNNKMQLDIDKAISESKNLRMFLTDPSEIDAANSHKVDVYSDSCDSIITSAGDKFAICGASYKPQDKPRVAMANKELILLNFGPKAVKAMNHFNSQSNGQSALWAEARNVTKTTILVLNNEKLKSSPSHDRKTITALVPTRLYTSPGVFHLYLLDTRTQSKSNVLNFTVN